VRSKIKTFGLLLGLFALSVIAELELETGVCVRPAHAVVGRPLTPVSYAGVARRTSRRTARRQDYYHSPGVW
jgi:hypothetical protein